MTEAEYKRKIEKLEKRIAELESMKPDITGMEAWSIVAPILAKYSDGQHFTVLDSAYVKVFCALKYWDERKKDGSN